MATSNLPLDDSGRAIQVLAPVDSGTVTQALTTTSAKVTLPEGSVYELYLDASAYLKVGTTAVTAADSTSRALPAGVFIYAKGPTDTHCHIRTLTGTGTAKFTQLR